MPDYTGGQFPSLDGDPEAEVAQRTEPDTEGSWFRKVFTVHNRAHTVGLPEDHEIHRNNYVGVLQAALQQGLHPKSEPELVSEEPHPSDPNHTNLTYQVQVVPAVADDDPGSTVTPSTMVGGHDLMTEPLPVYPETPSEEVVESHTPGTGHPQTPAVSEGAGEATGG